MIARGVSAETLYGRVVGVADGDTLTILDRDNRQRKIRVAGIDAPEKGQPFGEVSRQNLARLVFDRNVRAECYKEDRYRRQVCRLFDGSRDVALAQLDAGLAWWFRGSDAMLPSSHHRNGRSTHRPRIGRGQTRWGYGAIATRCRRGSGVT